MTTAIRTIRGPTPSISGTSDGRSAAPLRPKPFASRGHISSRRSLWWPFSGDAPAASGASPLPLTAWLARHSDEIAALDALLAEMRAAPAIDLAMLTVANRQLRALAAR